MASASSFRIIVSVSGGTIAQIIAIALLFNGMVSLFVVVVWVLKGKVSGCIGMILSQKEIIYLYTYVT